MSNEADYEYFMARAAKCRHLAVVAASPSAAAVHRKLSKMYETAAADLVIVVLANSKAKPNEKRPRLKPIIPVA
ncbi:MAG: hypothetical protein EON55_06305 [Alphaproteobacteria bacterium]|nr:MAG: hypothetical protein EON55_06305 [Alphaproteobacteria bacterium]